MPILDESGLPIQYVAVRNDISDHKQAETQLMQANKRLEAKVIERTTELAQRAIELERSNEELGKFAYVASHDLQEPLRTISSYTELLVEKYGDRLDGEADEYVECIVDGANRMQQLIRDLLTFFRLGTRGKAFSAVDCGNVVNSVLRSLILVVQESQAKVTCDNLPVVNADPSQVQQLFQNLIGNALKFRGKETPKIHVAARLLDSAAAQADETPQPESNQPENNQPEQNQPEQNQPEQNQPEQNQPEQAKEWEFCVRDNGIGINADYFDQIFEIFQCLHSRRHYEGTGIGLATCKKIVESYGGRIWLDPTTAAFSIGPSP